jgi:anti-anti-sigma factor
MEFKLIATTGRARGQAVEIRAVKFFIGRHGNCQLRPDIAGLAGIHALIEERDSRLYLRDFGAEGGTGINDRVLHAKEMEVFDGDLIQVGPMVLTLSIKMKGEGPRLGLMHAPDGWPYLEGVEDEPVRPTPAREQVAPKPRPAPSPEPAPLRVEPFLRLHPSLQPDLAVADTRASAATAVAQAPAHAPAAAVAPATAPRPFQPILTKPHGRRAIDCRMIDDVMVVSLLSPDLQEEETVSPVRYELRGLLEEEKVPSRMVIDMENTRYLSSRAVGVILAHYQGLERVGSTMRVCGVSKEIKPVLDQMRLSMLIDIYPSVDEAVQDSWD